MLAAAVPQRQTVPPAQVSPAFGAHSGILLQTYSKKTVKEAFLAKKTGQQDKKHKNLRRHPI